MKTAINETTNVQPLKDTIAIKDLILDRSILNLHMFASADKTRSAIRHVYFKFKEGALEVVATNGHYMSILRTDKIKACHSMPDLNKVMNMHRDGVRQSGVIDRPTIPDCAFTLDCDFLASIKPRKSDIVFLDFEIVQQPDKPDLPVTKVKIRVFDPISCQTVEHNNRTGIEIFPDYMAVMPTERLLMPVDEKELPTYHPEPSYSGFTMGLNPQYVGLFGQYCKKSLFTSTSYKWEFFGPQNPVKITKDLKDIGKDLKEIIFVVMPLRIK